MADMTHRHYWYSDDMLERPQDRFDQLWNFSDWGSLYAAILEYSIFHDLLILTGVFGTPTVLYYFYLTYTARATIEEGLYQRSALHTPLNYLERFDWAEVKLDRDTDTVLSEQFPDFDYMRQDQIHAGEAQQQLKYVEYDNM